LFFVVQVAVFGCSLNNRVENTAQKTLTSEKSDLEARSGKHFMYQGQYYDAEIELAYNRFRYYSPDQGRYISKDPIGLASGEYGFYNYVEDPNGWVDGFGLAKSYGPNKKTVYNGSSRRDAFRQAKRDADIPMSQKPTKVERPFLEDGYGNLVMKNGQPVTFREYHFKNNKGETVVIQEHSLGHTKATPQHGADPHFNVRPIDNTRTGSVPGTHGHYNF